MSEYMMTTFRLMPEMKSGFRRLDASDGSS